MSAPTPSAATGPAPACEHTELRCIGCGRVAHRDADTERLAARLIAQVVWAIVVLILGLVGIWVLA